MDASDENTLSIKRIIDAPREVVWRCWTEAPLLQQWYCPKPWAVPEADFNLCPGGRMNMIMAGPNGERVELFGIFLEIVPQQRLIFTDAFTEGFMPRKESFMTGMVELADTDDGRTEMTWSARHASNDDKQKHIQMGFEHGWSAAAEQLNELAQSLP